MATPALLNEQEQAAYYYARSRSRSFRDPAKGLSRTARLTGAAAIPIATIDTDAYFPDRARPLTFVTEIEITGAAASGIVWEFGSSTIGAKLAIDSGALYVAAGRAVDNVPLDQIGVDGSVAIDAIGATGARLLLTTAINPGTGEVRVWVDDDVVIRANAVAQLFDGWADTENGSLASAQATTSTQRGQAVNTAPADFALVRALEVYMGQLPRQFGA